MKKISKPDPPIPDQPAPQPAPLLPGDPVIAPEEPVTLPPKTPHDPADLPPPKKWPIQVPGDDPDQ